MKIELEKYYINRTWRYLLPCLNGHNDTVLVDTLNQLFKLAVGVHDTLLDGSETSEKKYLIYILLDVTINPLTVDTFLSNLVKKSYYVTDYCSEVNFQNARTRMIVLDIPKIHYATYLHFMKGEYSKMYTQEQIKSYFPIEKKRKEDLQVLTKDIIVRGKFVRELNRRFNTDMKLKDFDGECDFPLDLVDEIFNYTTKPVQNV